MMPPTSHKAKDSKVALGWLPRRGTRQRLRLKGAGASWLVPMQRRTKKRLPAKWHGDGDAHGDGDGEEPE